jgi:GTP cyclohydrolase I
MISAVQDKINEMEASGEDLSHLETANTPEELKKLFNKYCVSDAEIISETKDNNEADNTTDNDKDEDFSEKKEAPKANSSNDVFDPLTTANVIERDYTKPTSVNNEVIGEPTNMDEGFALPDDDDDNSGGGSQQKGGGEKKEKKAFNEDLKDLGEAQKRKAFKQTAKAIVMMYKNFSGKPFEWFITKDIKADKIEEAHVIGELDADQWLDLPDEVKLTVRQFFEQKCLEVDGMFTLDPEIEKELEEAVTDVLMEKQIALTPMQRVMMYVGQDLLTKGFAAFQFRSGINATLDYLKASHAETKEQENKKEPEVTATVSTDPKQEVKQPNNGSSITITEEN